MDKNYAVTNWINNGNDIKPQLRRRSEELKNKLKDKIKVEFMVGFKHHAVYLTELEYKDIEKRKGSVVDYFVEKYTRVIKLTKE